MSTILGLPANVVYATAAIYALLVIASIIVAGKIQASAIRSSPRALSRGGG
jgi:hypothetical protein